jgi:hypothetical protein
MKSSERGSLRENSKVVVFTELIANGVSLNERERAM